VEYFGVVVDCGAADPGFVTDFGGEFFEFADRGVRVPGEDFVKVCAVVGER